MNVKHPNFRSSAKGFTLIEIIVVVSIIAVLATMTVGGLTFYKRKAAENKTKVFVASVSRALDEYYSDFNRYPEGASGNLDGSTAILYRELYGDGSQPDSDGNEGNVGVPKEGSSDGKPDEGATVYLDALNPNLTGASINVEKSGSDYYLMDGFGSRLRYRNDPNSSDMQNPDYDLWSLGMNPQISHTQDDITNW